MLLRKCMVMLLCGILIMGMSGCHGSVTGNTIEPTQAETSMAAEESVQPSSVPTSEFQVPSVLKGKNETDMKVTVKTKQGDNEVTVEEYLCGVLAGEMNNQWSEETLKAQAVLARTFLLYYLSQRPDEKDATISTDTTESQAYNPDGINDKVKKAVSDTAGEILTYDNKAISAWFHSCSGGKTATAKEGLNYQGEEPPYIQVVESPEQDAPEEYQNWTANFTKEEVAKAISNTGASADNINSVKISATGESGRCTELTFGSTKVIGAEFRIQIGPDKMKSTLLTDIHWDGDTLIIEGKGFGHGVGMSQWGAYTMAQQGKTYKEILNYYFKNVNLIQAWK